MLPNWCNAHEVVQRRMAWACCASVEVVGAAQFRDGACWLVALH